ncbi:FAD binding domain-containing protein [Agathobaculum sp.]|uniref:FAD binding domain-containing protein n=1 Tax=Agathobaculum sp. TaxID=2048138 RepID=UPI002A801D73|nr:FAD binding domain-containing protein [Agathobaculum sp.]MDY3619528.1 FAD binding domain-containing protein [Agathobaculum sp.]
MSTFYQPAALGEALSLLAGADRPAVLAGGTDIVVARREGKRADTAYLDITRIPELRETAQAEGGVTLGAAVTFSEMENSTVLQTHFPLLCQAAASVGSPQIRSRGTVGGNVANASPAADVAPALAALDAVALVQSKSGARRVPVAELIEGAAKTALDPGELIVSFFIPALPPDTRQGFDKIGRRNALSIARLNGACALTARGGKIAQARLCIGAATNRPHRFAEAEALLCGRAPDEALFAEAGKLISAAILEETGTRASSVYKLPVAAEFTAALLRKTWEEGI